MASRMRLGVDDLFFIQCRVRWVGAAAVLFVLALPSVAPAACPVGAPGCCAVDADCDDGDACTGAETCDVASATCVAGTPVGCDDGDVCTDDACDPATGTC